MPIVRLTRSRSSDEGIAETALLDTDVGPLLIPAHDQVIRPFIETRGTWEPEESEFFRKRLRPGMVVLDVGAHCGYFTLLFAERVGAGGRVIAIEAERHNHELLLQNVSSAGVANVRAIHAAAARESGIVTLSISPQNTGDHRAYTWESGRDVVEVPALALDDLDPPLDALDVVKLDVQGTEHRAMEGMRRTISRFRPLMLVEFWPQGIRELGDDPADVLDTYRRLGFEITVLGSPEMEQDEMVEFADARVFCNLILSPAGPQPDPP
jgi:FkbM family methyltransferase